MSASTCPDGYQKIELAEEKLQLLVKFLVDTTEGPAEAIALLHAGIAAIDSANGDPRSAAQLGHELTFDLLAGGHRES